METSAGAVTGQDLAAWLPEGAVTLHNGEAMPADMVFFAPPPAQIGKVFSAFSSLRPADRPRSPMAKSITAAVIFVSLALLAEFTLVAQAGPREKGQVRMVVYIVAAVAGALSMVIKPFRRECTYVGELGLARFTLHKSLEADPKAECIEFKALSNVRSQQTRNYYNSVYTGTSYTYTWRDHDGKPAFTINGNYRSEQGTPKAHDNYWFALAAEASWSGFISNAMQAELDREGFVHFDVNKNDWVRIGPGFMEFCFRGNTDRIEADQIKALSLDGGHFTIKTHDAKWFSKKGTFRFDYSQMTNAKMFIFALEKLMGYQFGG